jgi:hypothetical protein
MTATKSPLSIALAMTLLAGTALVAGCSQPASTTTSDQVTTAPAPVMSSTTTDTQYRR